MNHKLTIIKLILILVLVSTVTELFGQHNNRFKGNTTEFYLPVVDLEFHPINEGIVGAFTLLLQCGGDGVLFKRS